VTSIPEVSTDPHVAPAFPTSALVTIDKQRDFRLVSISDAISRTRPDALREIAGIG